jgi:hypothetical protein
MRRMKSRLSKRINQLQRKNVNEKKVKSSEKLKRKRKEIQK